jgi:hypothetical protein
MASTDPRAVALYTAFGMQPQWPNYWIYGPTNAYKTSAHPDIEAQAAQAGDPALLAMDAEIGGRRRPEEHHYWVEQGDAVPLWFVREGKPIGYGYIQRRSTSSLWSPNTPTIGPLGAREGEYAIGVAAAAVRWASRYADTARLIVPGPHTALGALLQSGFRIAYIETFCSSAAGPFFDPRRYQPSGDAL